MLTNVDSCCPVQSYPFETINFSAEASHQSSNPRSIICIHNAISLARDVQKMSYVGGPQTIILTLKL